MAYDELTPLTLCAIVAAEFGEGAARDIARHFGGETVYVPLQYNPEILLHKILGESAANWLGREIGTFSYYVPIMGERRSEHLEIVDRLSREGLRVNDIAKTIGTSDRQVYILRAELRRLRRVSGAREP